MSRLTPSLLLLVGLAVGCKDQMGPQVRAPIRPEFRGLGGGGFDGSGEALSFPHWRIIPNFSQTGRPEQCFGPASAWSPPNQAALLGLCSVGGVFLTGGFAGLTKPVNPNEVIDLGEGGPGRGTPSNSFGVASTAVHGGTVENPLPSVAIKSGMQDVIGPSRAFSGKWILNFDYAFLTSKDAAAPNLDVASATILDGGDEAKKVTALRVDKSNTQPSQSCGNTVFSFCTGWQRAKFDLTPYPKNSILRMLVEEVGSGTNPQDAKDDKPSALAMDNFRIDPVFDATVSKGATIQVMAPFGRSEFPTSSYDWTVSPGTGGCSLISSDADVASVRCTHKGSADVSLMMNPAPPGEITPILGRLRVYDGAVVAGLGWVDSPAGSLPYMTNSGRAGFAFASKYPQTGTVPVGVTGFTFQAGNLRFTSARYEWLVIAGAQAQFTGVGKVNGAGDFRFLLTAIDGAVPGGGGVDRFQIQIWDRRNTPNTNDDLLVYDNGDASALRGGSIVIAKQ